MGEVAARGVENGARRSPALVLALCLAVAALDGLDVPILGLALPVISREWGVQPSDFVMPTALGLIGMGLGTSVLGALGDRYGAHRMMVVSTLLFGAATALLYFANSMTMLSALRLVGGIGLGGALPNALSLIAMHAPPERKLFWLASVGTAMQAGGVAAGLIASLVLAPLGWRALMLIGGVLPIVLCVALILLIPQRQPTGTATGEQALTISASFAALFAKDQRRRTLIFWSSFAVLYLGLYLIPTWLPAVLANSGFPVAVASVTLAAFNLAGIAGGILMSVTISRAGIRTPLLVVSVIGAAWAALPIFLLSQPDLPQPVLIAAMGLQGFFAVATLVALVAFVSDSYETRIRGTGTGAALAAARIGAVLSSFLGAAIVAAGSSVSFFAAVGGSLAVCALLCALTPRPASKIPYAQVASDNTD